MGIELYGGDAHSWLISVLAGDDFKIPSGHSSVSLPGKPSLSVNSYKICNIWEKCHENCVCQSSVAALMIILRERERDRRKIYQ